MDKFEIGIYGLGVMGSALARNAINCGFRTAAYSKSPSTRQTFAAAAEKCGGQWQLFESEGNFVKALVRPRVIMLMITAGNALDQVLSSLYAILDEGDVVIDGGNSNYADTNRRCAAALEHKIHFLGTGVSGGEKGALEGPSIMAGGSYEGWKIAGRFLTAMAAKNDDGSACCSYVGAQGAGHYVKMVHNGIEYGIMQQISDVYAIMRDCMGMSADEIGDVFDRWNRGPLCSYLVESAGYVLHQKDADGSPLIDKILDVAHQKGTGKWCVEEAASRGVYVSCMDEALFTRYHSENAAFRHQAAAQLPVTPCFGPDITVDELEGALFLSIVCSYAQGIALIKKASDDFGWNIDMPAAVGLWRSGCIIRSVLLKRIMDSLSRGEEQLLLSSEFQDAVSMEVSLRKVCTYALSRGTAIPSVNAAMVYYDQCRTARMSVNMVQGLRDFFGAHTYERIDAEGVFHTHWNGSI